MACSAAVFAVALAARAIHLWQMSDAAIYRVLICDPRQYDQWAQRIAGGEWLGDEVFYQTPLYPYFLAVVYSIFGHSIWAVRIAQALMGAMACAVTARAGARLFSETTGIAAGLLLAVYPPAIFFDGILQKASLDLLLVAGLVWILAAAQDKRHWPWFALAGVLLGAATLNRENAAALIPVFSVWTLWIGWRAPRRAALGWAAALLLGAAAVLVPVGARNYYVGGLFALTTSQMGTNFYIGNRATANGTYETLRPGRGDPKLESLDARVLAEQTLNRRLTPGEVSRFWMQRAFSEIRRDVGRWFRLMGFKWMLTWNSVELIDAESLYTHERYSTVLAVAGPFWHFGVLCPLAVLGAWWTRRDWRQLAFLYAFVLTMAAAVTLFYVFARYRYPMVVPLVLFAAAGLVGAVSRLRLRTPTTTREIAIACVLLIVVALGCNWPLVNHRQDDAVTFYNAGVEFRDTGRLDEAAAMWRAALAINPQIFECYNALGRVALAKGDLHAARTAYEQGRRINPQYAVFSMNLGIVAAELGEELVAAEYFAEAISLDPLALVALGDLAEKEKASGRTKAELAMLRAAAVAAPHKAITRARLGQALLVRGRVVEALTELRAAVQLDENLIVAANALAWVEATSPDDAQRNGPEAVALAERVCQATEDKVPQFLDTLAAAYAECGRFDEAVAACDKALRLAGDDPELIQELGQRKQLYTARTPYRSPSFEDRPRGAP